MIRQRQQVNRWWKSPPAGLFSSAGERCGFTLIEFVVGLVLLATLVTVCLIAIGRQQRKIEFAKSKTIAVDVADQLMTQWLDSSEGIPVNSQGAVVEQPNWIWQTRLLGSKQIAGYPIPCLRVSVMEVGPDGQPRELVSLESLQVAAGRIDLPRSSLTENN